MSASTSGSKVVKLRSSDDEIFEVEEAVVMKSETIRNMMEDCGGDGEIPVPNVDGRTLSRIIEWCKNHSNDKMSAEEVKKVDAEFVDVDESVLYDLIMAANYLNIKQLLDQLAQKVADMIKGKSPEQIRKTFKITNDFTPEEEQKIRSENSWAFES